MPEQPSEPGHVVTSFIAAIESLDLEAALSFVTEDCEYDNVPIGKVHGPEGIRQILGAFLAGCTEIEWLVHHQLADPGGIVMNERLDRFRFGEVWIELPVAGLFEVRDGRIALWRDYFDQGTLMSAMARLAPSATPGTPPI